MGRSDIRALVDRLRSIVGAGALVDSPDDAAPYVVDWRKRLKGEALCVAFPQTTAEVAAVVAACHEAGVAVVPQGGNTGSCGAATPDASGNSVVLNLRRMNRIRDVDPANHTITVEAGCILHDVQQAAEAADRLFPLSLGAEGSCQIGGNLSTNAGGVHVLRYGNTRDLALGLEVVLPDGRVWDGLRGLRKDNTGYDLKHLFIGAEGTLGVITAAVLKLFPLPMVRVVAWLGLPTPDAAVALLADALGAFGARLVAFELLGDLPVAYVLQHIPGVQRPLDGTHPWHVLLEITDSDDEAGLREKLLDFLSAQAEAGRVDDAVISQNEEQVKRLWRLRESVPEAQIAEGYSIKHDISLPVSRIPEFLIEAERRLVAELPGIRVTPFGHLGDGNLHYNTSRPLDWTDADFAAATPRVSGIVHGLVNAMNGSISAEHGLGQTKRDESARYKPPLELELMRRVKHALDPQGVMNPGKVLR